MKTTSYEAVIGLWENAAIACWANHGLDNFFLSNSRNLTRKPGCSLDSGDVVKLEIAELRVLRNRIVCNTRSS